MATGFLDMRGATIVTCANISNSTARPAVGTGEIAGEIHSYGCGTGTTPIASADDGLLRLSAGGGTSAVKSYVDICGSGADGPVIVLGTANTERVRIGNGGLQVTAGIQYLTGNNVLSVMSTNSGQFLAVECYNSNNTVKFPIALALHGGGVVIGTTPGTSGISGADLFVYNPGSQASQVMQSGSSSAFWVSAIGNMLAIGGTGATAPASGAININNSGGTTISGALALNGALQQTSTSSQWLGSRLVQYAGAVSLSLTVGSATRLATFNVGPGIMKAFVTQSGSNINYGKLWEFPVSFNLTSGVWVKLLPAYATNAYFEQTGSGYDLEISITNGTALLRIVRTATGGNDVTNGFSFVLEWSGTSYDVASFSVDNTVETSSATTYLDPHETWKTPTLLNSWVNYNTTTYVGAGYYRDRNGTVWIRGLVAGGASGTTIFTLPVGYRPLLQHHFAIDARDGFGQLVVDNAGNVVFSSGAIGGTGTYASISGISFSIF